MFSTHPVFKQIQSLFKQKLLDAQKEYDEKEAEIDKQHQVELLGLAQKTACEKELAASGIATKFFGTLAS